MVARTALALAAARHANHHDEPEHSPSTVTVRIAISPPEHLRDRASDPTCLADSDAVTTISARYRSQPTTSSSSSVIFRPKRVPPAGKYLNTRLVFVFKTFSDTSAG